RAAFSGAREGQALFPYAAAHGTSYRPLYRHRSDHRTEHLTGRDRDPQTVKGNEMHERDEEGRKNRHSEDLVGNGNAGERHHRTQHQVKNGQAPPDRFTPQPFGPAARKFSFLVRRECIDGGKEIAPLLSKNLKPAIGPAIALFLISVEGVG